MDGWVYAAGDKLWIVDAQGDARAFDAQAEDGSAIQWKSRLVGASSGFALVHDSSLTWFAAGKASTITNTAQVVLAKCDDSVVALVAIVNEDGSSTVLHLAEPGSDGRWSPRRLPIGNAEPLGIHRKDGRWYLVVRRRLSQAEYAKAYGAANGAASSASDDEFEASRLCTEIWTSTDGEAWQRCALPETVRDRADLASAQCATWRGTTVVVWRNLVLQSTAPDAFAAIGREGPFLPQYDESLFVVGDTLHAVERNRWRSTSNLRSWTTRVGNGRVPLAEAHALRAGKLVSLILDKQLNKLVEVATDELYAATGLGGAPAIAKTLERIEIGGDEVYSAPIWNGWSFMLAGSTSGTLRSQDGVQWRPVSEWRNAYGTDLVGLMATKDGVVGWTRGMPELRSWSTVSRAEFVPSDLGYGRGIAMDFNAVHGATDGETLAFLACPPKDPGDGSGWTLRATRNQGDNWTTTPSPVRKPSHFEHGPFGWTVLGLGQQGEQKVLALSRDLVDWRTLELPKVHSFDLDETCQVGGRLHVLGATGEELGMADPDQSPFSSTLDGNSWSTRMLPVGLNARLVVDGTRLWVVDEPTILASLDGSRWHRMPEGVLPPNTVHLLHRDDTMLAVTRWMKNSASFSGELWRGPAITDERIRAAPLEDTPEYEAPTPQSRWVHAVAICDEALALAKDEFQRSSAVAKLGEAYFAANPGSTRAQQAQDALVWVNRLLTYQYDEDAMIGAANAGSKFGGADPGCQRELLELFHPDLRKVMRDRASSTLDGTQRQYKLTNTKKLAPGPQKSAAPFDLRRRREAAARGDLAAMYDLGQMYLAGVGVPQDQAAAGFWHEQAKRGGFVPPNESPEAFEASIKLGSYRTMIQRFTELNDPEHPSFDRFAALTLARRGAAAGFVPLQLTAADMLSSEARLPSAAREPLRMVQAAADLGDADACGTLGTYYEKGWGVERNLDQAVALYRRGASLEDPLSMRLLGELLLEGKGVPRDASEGMRLLERAAALGEDYAKTIIQEHAPGGFHVCYRPFTLELDCLPIQFDWTTRMMQAGVEKDPAAIYDMMWLYRSGLGRRADELEARHWERKLAAVIDPRTMTEERWADAGSIVATHRVAGKRVDEIIRSRDDYRDAALDAWLPATKVNFQSMHDAAVLALGGTPSKERIAEALAWLESAARGGHESSALLLAGFLDEGRYGPADPARALDLFRQTALLSRQGQIEAAWRLATQPDEEFSCVRLHLDAAFLSARPQQDSSDEGYFVHLADEVRRIQDAARDGDLEAMPSAALLAARPPKVLVEKGLLAPDPESAMAWAWTYKALWLDSNLPVNVYETVRKLLPDASVPQPRTSLLVQRTKARLDAQIGKDSHALAVAASAPERSRNADNARRFLDGQIVLTGTFDEELIPGWNTILLGDTADRIQRAAPAGQATALRGTALLEAIAGVTASNEPDAYAKRICALDADPGTNLLRSELRQLEAVRRYYGIGCASDLVEALAWLLVDEDETDTRWRAIAWIHDQLSDPMFELARARAAQLRGWRTAGK